jgi:hypothetical protein
VTRAEPASELFFEAPFGARHATKEIQANRLMFRKGMAREMRFREKAEASETAGAWELMPHCFPNGAEAQIGDQRVEQRSQNARIAQRFRTATPGFDDPLDSVHS